MPGKSIFKARFNGVGGYKLYTQTYWKQEHIAAIERLKKLSLKSSLPFKYNSMLGGAKGDCVVLEECSVLVDCVVLVASRMEQLQINM